MKSTRYQIDQKKKKSYTKSTTKKNKTNQYNIFYVNFVYIILFFFLSQITIRMKFVIYQMIVMVTLHDEFYHIPMI